MKCPKCNGRTVLDDVHTYLGREQERRCLVCGKRFIEPPAPEAVEEKRVTARGPVGQCSICQRDNQVLTRGMCSAHYQAWRKGKLELPVDNAQNLEPDQTAVEIDCAPAMAHKAECGSKQEVLPDTTTLAILKVMAERYNNASAVQILEELKCSNR